MQELLKIQTIWPEIAVFIGAVVCLITGLSSCDKTRKATPWVAGLSLIVAALLVPYMAPNNNGLGLGGMVPFIKLGIVGVGLILLLIAWNVPDELSQVRKAEQAKDFEPGDSSRGEFFAFFLFSIAGAMLTAGAGDLVWLFLALELTSLPTYIMIASGRDKILTQESAVKYFFLGAMSAAIFLYGFTLIYGATGYTDFAHIHEVVSKGSISPLMLAGIILSILGIGFKTALVPMHFYTADVYQGAPSAVSAFIAFVPKTAGFMALILILGLVGWPLDKDVHIFGGGDVLTALIWALAAVTMTVGNVLALLQTSIKRVLAYSSIAHSGYMLVGLLVGSAAIAGGALGDGIAAIMFYLLAYGLATAGGFAVLGCLKSHGEEAETYDDISGLVKKHPQLAAIMLISMLSLMGMPIFIGFLGKIYLIGSIYQAGFWILVVILVLNSAISAGYYLRIGGTCFFGKSPEYVQPVKSRARWIGAGFAGIAVIVLGIPGGLGGALANGAHKYTAQGATKAKVSQKQTVTNSALVKNSKEDKHTASD